MRRLVPLFLLVACTGRIKEPNGTPEDRVEPPPAQTNDPIPFAPVAPLVRRLTNAEYANTVRDVLGVTLTEAELAELPVDRPLEGFVNIASGQPVLPGHAITYAALAEIITADAATASFVEAHTTCTDADETCARAFARSAGQPLFRRPVNDDEATAFGALYLDVRAEMADHEEAARAVLQAMLQSPTFLYLIERESEATIAGYEMASRLSYALWATAPDEALYTAASSGALDTPQGVGAQVDRLLADEQKLSRVLDRFLVDWSRLDAIPNEDGRKEDLVASAAAFYRTNALEDASLFSLLTDRRAFLTPPLAQDYGVTAEGDEMRAYDVSGLPGRGGLLAQPGVVAGMTNADGGAIVARGLFIQHQLFCQDVPDPPATLQEAIDVFLEEQPEDASDRQIAETRLMRGECASCHAQFDPLAYGFEHLDFRGRFRVEDEHGNAVRTDGWIPRAFSPERRETKYDTFEAYMASLAGNPFVRSCFVKLQMEHFLGHRLDFDHRGSVEQIKATLEAGDESYRSLVHAMATHDIFRTREVR